jgi:REP element-mobilizing transposase RayT
MPHSFTKNHLHIIFGTKERRKLIPQEMLPRMWAYIAGICRNHDIFPVIVGGMRDHAHVLIDLPARIDLAQAVRLLKTNSSKWMGEMGIKFRVARRYGAFGVSVSNLPAVIRYIQNQEKHHRKMGFKDEYLAFLRKHGVDFDPRYVFA